MEDGAKTTATTTWIACGCRDGSILFWNSQTVRSHDGTSSSSSSSSSITLRHHTRGVPQLIFSSPPPLSSLSVVPSPAPRAAPLLLASASLDGKVRLWKVLQIPAMFARDPSATAASHVIGEGLGGRRPAAYTIAFSPNGQELACAYVSANNRADPRTGKHSNISIWSTRSSSSSSSTEDASSSSSSSGSDEDDTEVDIGEVVEEEGEKQCLHRWGAGEGSKLFVSMAYYNNYDAASTTRSGTNNHKSNKQEEVEDESGRYLASCRENETTVTVWDLKGSMIERNDEKSTSSTPPSVCAILTGHSRSICHMVSSPATTPAHQKRYLATASNDGTVRLWNIPHGTCAQVLGQVDESGGFASPVRTPRVFGGDGGMGTDGSPNMTAAAPLSHSQEDKEEEEEEDRPVEGASAAVLLRQRPRAIAAATAGYNSRLMGRGGSAPISDATSSNTATSINRSSHALRSIVFDPTGLTLASARLDGTICVWRVSDGTCLAKWSCHFENMFLSLGFCNTSPFFHNSMVDGSAVGTSSTTTTSTTEQVTEKQNGSPTTTTSISSIVVSGSSGGKFRFDRVNHHQQNN
jgi:WD40 repeat protein